MHHRCRTAMELRAGSLQETELRVRRIRGRERLSETYAFTVDFTSSGDDSLDWSAQVGEEAVLTVRRPSGSARSVHGVLWRAELTGVAAGRPSYRVLIVPRLERLKHRIRSRVFQSMNVAEIVEKVLKEHEIGYRLSLSRTLTAREYCVQYRESDFDFVSRLLEFEGIFYWFEHGPDSHVVVLADDQSGCVELPEGNGLPFRTSERAGAEGEEEYLHRLALEHHARSETVVLRDYDFERPEMEIEGQSQTQGGSRAEVYEYPGGFKDPAEGKDRARLRLEGLRSDAETWTGQGTCQRFFPGAVFEVKGHHAADYDQSLLLVEVQHEGLQVEGAGEEGAIEHEYRNSFVAREKSSPIPPRRRTARPTAMAETATVVGPSGEEIWVDKYGRVRVHFHWDREGTEDDKASCWVRVAQSWSGAAWGAQFAPRIGQEVLVRFFEGDPDQPVIVGAVYNGWNRTPIHLPHDKTKSTVRTDSSLGGDGSNELLFEDLKGGEEIFLHAQKDEKIEVKNDKGQLVKANEVLEVVKDRMRDVRGNQLLGVDGDDASTVGVNEALSVTGDRDTTVQGDHSETVGVAQTLGVSGSRDVVVSSMVAQSVGAAAALTIGAGYAINVVGAENVAVGGALTREVGGEYLEAIGMSRDEDVAGNSTSKVGGDFGSVVRGEVVASTEKDQKETISERLEAFVEGPVSWLGKELELEADEFSLVVGGTKALSIDKSGKVKFGAKTFTVDGQAITLEGSKVAKEAPASPDAASVVSGEKKQKPDFVEFELKDERGKALAGKQYELRLKDGSVKKGQLDGRGHARVEGIDPEQCILVFPE